MWSLTFTFTLYEQQVAVITENNLRGSCGPSYYLQNDWIGEPCCLIIIPDVKRSFIIFYTKGGGYKLGLKGTFAFCHSANLLRRKSISVILSSSPLYQGGMNQNIQISAHEFSGQLDQGTLGKNLSNVFSLFSILSVFLP